MMETNNQRTLQTYEQNFDKYIEGTPNVTSGSQKEWLDFVLSLEAADATILEIGSAFGRDAQYIRDKGYTNLQVSDAFDAAVATLKEQGFSPQKLNVLTDDIQGYYDIIMASAVFLHFTSDELKQVLQKIHQHITADGILAFTVKTGRGEEWSTDKVDGPRFFHYWTKEELVPFVQEQGFNLVDVRLVENDKWLCITAKRRSSE